MNTKNALLKGLGFVARLLGTAFIMFVAFMISAGISGADAVELSPEEAQTSGIMVLLFSIVNSLVLSFLALRSKWYGWKLVGAIILIQFGVETFMSQIETVVFNQALQLTVQQAITLFSSGLIRALIFAPLAVWVLGKFRRETTDDKPDSRLVFSAGEWIKRLSLLAALYTVVYFIFGYFVAWQWAETRQFYSGSTEILPFFTHMTGILRDDPGLIVIQFVRGLMWAGLAALIVRISKGRTFETCLMVALTFSVLLAIFVLFPNPFMPTIVRYSHFFELSSSMLVYGALTAWILLRPVKSTRMKSLA